MGLHFWILMSTRIFSPFNQAFLFNPFNTIQLWIFTHAVTKQNVIFVILNAKKGAQRDHRSLRAKLRINLQGCHTTLKTLIVFGSVFMSCSLLKDHIQNVFTLNPMSECGCCVHRQPFACTYRYDVFQLRLFWVKPPVSFCKQHQKEDLE